MATRKSLRLYPLACVAGLLFWIFASVHCALADDGQPIALRQWPGGRFTIETMWNLNINVGGETKTKETQTPSFDFDSRSIPEIADGDFGTVRRLVNAADSEFIASAADLDDALPNDISISSLPIKDQQNFILSVEADGVLILFFNGLDADQTRSFLAAAHADIQGTSLMVVATDETFDAELCGAVSKKLSPKTMVVGAHVTSVLEQPVTAISHNTLLVAATPANAHDPQPRVVTLTDVPYEMSEALAELFSKKETACSSSREMFSKLTVEQMNFRPANDTHTPRWNAEHMMGRELLFFSQIYHAVDPHIGIMNLNPKQMPDQYQAAHPDWDGAEEARQMLRIEAFTRRFAYLLDGMDLDAKSVGSKFWSPRGLLEQMERHYNEHSANVLKKMELEGWPSK